MLYKFEIKQEIVMQRVSRTTAYIATRRLPAEAASAYDNVAVHTEDWEMLKPHFMDACNNLTAYIQRYVMTKTAVDTDNSTVHYDYELSMPSNWDFNRVDIVEAALEFVTASVLADWLTVTEKEKAEDFAASAKAYLDLIGIGLHSRRRPKRYF